MPFLVIHVPVHGEDRQQGLQFAGYRWLFRALLALELEPLIAAQAKERQATSTGGVNPRPLFKRTEVAPIDTREVIADTAGLSPATIYRVKTVQQQGTPEVKEAMKNEETTQL